MRETLAGIAFDNCEPMCFQILLISMYRKELLAITPASMHSVMPSLNWCKFLMAMAKTFESVVL
jgi:hypothetical protein